MKKINLTQIIKQHGFKIMVFLFLIFIAFKKDLNFQVQLNAPDPVEKQYQRTTTKKRDVRLTEDADKKEIVIDRLDLSPFGSKRNTSHRLVDELNTLDKDEIYAFINRFKHVAENEQEKYGIPASIILGNALLLSQAGQKDFAKHGNSFFALPCTTDWQGETGQYDNHCLRHYENAWTSFRDFSFYWSTYLFPNGKEVGSYKAAIKAIKEVGFGVGQHYPSQLQEVIKTYNLVKFDA